MASLVSSYLGGFTDAFAVAGAVSVSYIALKVCLAILKMFGMALRAKSNSVGSYLRSKGTWAVVTGATYGIGKAYVQELAKYGMNVVLISRTQSKLEAVAAEIESQYKVKTKVIAADFSKGMEIYNGIRIGLSGLEIGVLVNNVGLSYDFPEYFLDLPDREKLCMDLMNVNCTSVTMMSGIVMPGMAERKKGVVINISSAAGLTPTPLLSVYSACKAYVTYLTECLNLEYYGKGINVQCVSPYFVCSNMSKIRKPNLFMPTPSTYVRSALNTVNVDPNTLGYWPHTLTHLFRELLPFGLSVKMNFSALGSARKRALKRMAGKKTN